VSGPRALVEELAAEVTNVPLVVLGEAGGDSLEIAAGVASLSISVKDAASAHGGGLSDLLS